uniref:Uncharacterized protein n=1 Tax=Anguilla anguilla TaxID=7936 RepID=A0A0E9SC30_ANGAN
MFDLHPIKAVANSTTSHFPLQVAVLAFVTNQRQSLFNKPKEDYALLH